MSLFENLKSATGKPLAITFAAANFLTAPKNTKDTEKAKDSSKEDDYAEIDIKEEGKDAKKAEKPETKEGKQTEEKKEYNQKEFEESGAKADRSLGTTDKRIIGDYYVEVPKDRRWQKQELSEKEVADVVKEYIATPGLLWATGSFDENGDELPASYQEKTTYTDGTTKVDIYDYGKLTESTIVRYSGDPDNPQEGDQKTVEVRKYNEDGSYSVRTTTTTWVDTDGITGWYDDLVYRPMDTKVYDAEGNEVSYDDKHKKSEWKSIYSDSQFGLPRGERYEDGSYKAYDIEYKE